MPKVSVVIINAKGIQRLEKCLKSLAQTNYPNFEVTVVDCLTPNLSTWIEKHFPKTKVIHYDIDIGPSASHNVEERFIDFKSEYLAFLDNDSYVTENWLTELLKIVEKDKKIGVAQAKIVLLRDKQRLDHGGMAIDALGTWYTTRNLHTGKFEKVFDIFAASSAACIVRREVFYEVGGFDPDYFIYDDDTDFSFRVHLLGYRIIYVPSAIVFHEGETARSLNPRKLYHGAKNRMCTILKNYELKNALWRFSLYLSLAFLSGIGLFLARKTAEAKAMFRSIVYPVVNIKRILIKRALIQHQRRVADSELFQKCFIMNNIRPTVSDLMSKLQLLQK
ncbi:glycosyltransferase family 2 protein [Candidatus Bathyarchaeota archaeon]|nr:glycosyltransferase family 2 protein [Candidatus Bathyarchaeota archaeon]